MVVSIDKCPIGVTLGTDREYRSLKVCQVKSRYNRDAFKRNRSMN